MTREKWLNLSDEARRVKVAELCGWKKSDSIYSFEIGVNQHGFWKKPIYFWLNPKGEQCLGLPEYLTDLNAMHEAEELIYGDERWRTYEGWLWDTTNSIEGGGDLIHATAAQRAEALALTMEPEDI